MPYLKNMAKSHAKFQNNRYKIVQTKKHQLHTLTIYKPEQCRTKANSADQDQTPHVVTERAYKAVNSKTKRAYISVKVVVKKRANKTVNSKTKVAYRSVNVVVRERPSKAVIVVVKERTCEAVNKKTQRAYRSVNVVVTERAYEAVVG